MISRIIAVAVCTVAALPGHCHGDDGWATALFQEKSVDFGAVPRGSILRHNFVLTNTTGDALNILDIHASCGCTSGRAHASTVQPGQKTTIEAQIDTRNFVGVKV